MTNWRTYGVTTVAHANAREIERLNADLVEDVAKVAKYIPKDDDINFTMALSNSIRTGREGPFKTLEIAAPYAIFVEFGLPPGHKVNFDALHN